MPSKFIIAIQSKVLGDLHYRISYTVSLLMPLSTSEYKFVRVYYNGSYVHYVLVCACFPIVKVSGRGPARGSSTNCWTNS